VHAVADLDATIESLARPLAERAGLDLVEVAVKGEGTRRRVKVVVDRKGGVDLASCQDLSRDLGRALDEADPLAQRYTLEVTSPGTDRPLADRRAFDRVEGRLVRALLRTDDDERTEEVRGTVGEAREDAVVLTLEDGTAALIPYDRIVKATQQLPW
jgi:ribosome maturation factor RimP